MESTGQTAALWQVAQLLIPILTPMLVAGVRMLVPKIPKVALPILAPIVGALAAGLSGVTDLSQGATLGLAGVGVREIINQARKPPNA